MQNFANFSDFGPKQGGGGGGGGGPPKSGQKWQKVWSTAIGLQQLGDGIGIYLVPEKWEKKGKFGKICKKL